MLQKLINYSEDKAFQQLKGLEADENIRVFSKVRLADVFKISASGITDELYTYALKSHFDFLVCDDEHYPLFAVEFDGPSHNSEKQQLADRKKNSLAKKFKFPLLRIGFQHLSPDYNNRSLLVWIIEVYRLQEHFYEAQSKGQIPPDEPFDPFFFSTISSFASNDLDNRYPYWISLKANLAMKKLAKSGRIHDASSSGVVFYDDDQNMYAIEYIRVTPNAGLFVRLNMKSQYFPIYFGDLLNELALIFIYEKIKKYCLGKIDLVSMSKIDSLLDEYDGKFSRGRTHSYTSAKKSEKIISRCS